MENFSKKPFVYIACPYTNGAEENDITIIETNVAICMNAVEDIFNSGRYTPYMTLLSHYYQQNHYVHDWESWMEYSFQIVSNCQALVRLPGASKGADMEVEFAKWFGIPVYYSVEDLLK